MKNKIRTISFILAAMMLTISLCGCNSGGDSSDTNSSSDITNSESTGSTSSSSTSSGTSVDASSDDSADSSEDPESSSGDQSSSSCSSNSNSTSSSTSASSSYKPPQSGIPTSSTIGHGDSAMEVIPKAEQTARVEGDRITFTIDNVFSEGQYYSIKVSGVKSANQSAGVSVDTTYINGVLYGDFRLDLYRSGELIDTLKINVPRDDSFLILENAAIGKDYGCTLMSHKQTFSTDAYPDMLRLDFFRQRGMAVPQYARYFGVFDDKLSEIPFYEKGKEVAPIGTFAEMRGDGLLTQNLTVENGKGGYTVIKYEYRFDVENRRLNRTQVRFTGWGN